MTSQNMTLKPAIFRSSIPYSTEKFQ